MKSSLDRYCHSIYVVSIINSTVLAECSAFLASGSDPTDDSIHAPTNFGR